MAKVFKAPFDPPPFRHESWREDEEAYLAELRVLARARNKGALVGEIVSFPMADSGAVYMVWSESPFALIHLAIGDAWQIPDAHMRGLRKADVKAMVDRSKRIAALFAEKEGKA